MKILVTGGTGFIGRYLVKRLLKDKHEIFIAGRNKNKIQQFFENSVTAVEWNPVHLNNEQATSLREALQLCDAVIHLAGENISSQRWNEKFKQQIYNSRIKSTQLLVELIKENKKHPDVFISSSAIGYYGIKNRNVVTENSGAGDDFMSQLCVDWENASADLEKSGIRRAVIRTGIVLNKNEGALKRMLMPYRLFIGGPLGPGKQWFPWIHYRDVVNVFLHVLNNNLSGSFNAVAPDIVTMKKFGMQLGKELKRPSLFPVPKFVLKIITGEAADYFTEGVKIKPVRLAETGFDFEFGELDKALTDLL